MKIEGIWVPLITPFYNGELDRESYQKLIDHYIKLGVSGLIPLGTTGESPAISETEFEKILDWTVEMVGGRVPIFAGAGGNYTDKVVHMAKTVEKYPVSGILSVSPYFNRPDQRGIYEHFLKISESTRLSIVMYNIPYRTGRNMENSTIRRLAELPNIVGLKDACGDIKQSMELLLDPPADFSILTGEDILFYSTLTLGGSGGILAAAHLDTERYIQLYHQIKKNDYFSALENWKKLAGIIPLLFLEPNPAPIKYRLWKKGLIRSAETRLPIVGITDELKERLDR